MQCAAPTYVKVPHTVMSEGERHGTFFNYDEWQSIYRSLLSHICKKVANNLHVAFLIPQNLRSCIIEAYKRRGGRSLKQIAKKPS